MTTTTTFRTPPTPASRSVPATQRSRWPAVGALLSRYFAVLAFVAICVFFTLQTSVFFTSNNFVSVVGQGALLAIVATGMTVVIRSGGIDLSVAVALDIGALVCVWMIDDGYIVGLSVAAGIGAGALMGLTNGLVISYLKVSPFLTTLSMLFIGTSLQRIVTGGGEPIYLPPASVPAEFSNIGQASILGLPAPVWIAAAILVVGYVLLERLRAGRQLTSVGAQSPAALFTGVPVRRVTIMAYVFSSTVCAIAGIALASRVSSYIPLSGEYYLLDAIGAVFIGTTLHKESRPTVFGTLLGVAIFTVLANGLNLVGLSFYWQGFARGLVLLIVLGLSVLLAKRRAGGRPRPVRAAA